ncbi:hypothetical protein M0812_17988 [Anaeramoeba flamelloides]|uniref:Saposin B-type domain-containing protein n=1 Tax=Anaeramoeba flamelloides TaxID=1746091 RepID=A0AAV7Z1F3_9EUKA|nr:hypothetical protein M0812_17988 [Anaeramoeba flamelloides]
MKLTLFLLFAIFCAVTLTQTVEKKEGGIGCLVCTTVVSAAEQYLADGKTEAQIEALLDKECNKLPIGKTQCQDIVNEDVPKIIQFLEEKKTPQEICSLLGLCTSEVEEKTEGGIECIVCTTVVSAAEQYLADGKTEAQIEALLDKVCEKLPIGKSQCEDIVNEDVPKIIQFLEEKKTPQEICSLLGLCTSEVEEKTEGGIECIICTTVVNAAEKYLASGKTEAQIEVLLDKVCEKLPIGKSQCKDIVKQYVPEIIQLLEESKTPEEICSLIGLCTSEVEEKTEGGIECTVCDILIGLVEKYIEEGKTEEEIEKLLDKECALLGSSYEAMCKTLVEEYVPTFIDYIEQHQSADTICSEIGLC